MLQQSQQKGNNTVTKQQAKAEFAKAELPHIPKRDIPAIRQAWNEFVDERQKAGEITLKQAETWVNPFLKKKDR